MTWQAILAWPYRCASAHRLVQAEDGFDSGGLVERAREPGLTLVPASR